MVKRNNNIIYKKNPSTCVDLLIAIFKRIRSIVKLERVCKVSGRKVLRELLTVLEGYRK